MRLEAGPLIDGNDQTMRLLDPSAIERIPWQPVEGCPGIREKQLWSNAELVYALIHYAPGSRTPGHSHQIADHHIWVIGGRATIGGRPVVAGSYVHVPVAVEHPIQDVGPDGLTLLQLHHRYPRF